MMACASKKEEVTNDSSVETNKLSEEYLFKIKEIISDSRCPEGVNCIWEGQIEMIVEVYNKNKLVEEKELIVNSKTIKGNATWASKYSEKQVEFIGILPNKVEGVPIYKEDYKLLIKYN